MACVLLGVTRLSRTAEQPVPSLACARRRAAPVVSAADMPKELQVGRSCCRASTVKKSTCSVRHVLGKGAVGNPGIRGERGRVMRFTPLSPPPGRQHSTEPHRVSSQALPRQVVPTLMDYRFSWGTFQSQMCLFSLVHWFCKYSG